MRHAFRPRNRNIEPNETGISTRLRHCCLLGIYLRANFNIPVGARKCELARVYKSLFEIFRTYTAHSSSTPANLITFFPPVRSAAFRHVCVAQVSVIWSNGKKKIEWWWWRDGFVESCLVCPYCKIEHNIGLVAIYITEAFTMVLKIMLEITLFRIQCPPLHMTIIRLGYTQS